MQEDKVFEEEFIQYKEELFEVRQKVRQNKLFQPGKGSITEYGGVAKCV